MQACSFSLAECPLFVVGRTTKCRRYGGGSVVFNAIADDVLFRRQKVLLHSVLLEQSCSLYLQNQPYFVTDSFSSFLVLDQIRSFPLDNLAYIVAEVLFCFEMVFIVT